MSLRVGLVVVLGALVAGRLASAEAVADVGVTIERAAAAAGSGRAAAGGADPLALLDEVEDRHRRGVEGGAGVCVLGVPGSGERLRVASAARELIGVCAAAMAAIDAADGEDQAELLGVARETVVPLRAARGALWLACCSEEAASRASWCELAIEICEGVEGVTSWALVERHAVLGLARLTSGDDEASAVALGSARSGIAERPEIGERDPWSRVEIEAATVLVAARLRGLEEASTMLARLESAPPFRVRGVRDWGLALLGADVAHRISAGTDPRRVLERSLTRYGALVDARDVSERDREARRRDVFERCRRVVRTSGVEASHLPLLGVAAVAAGVDAQDDAARRRVLSWVWPLAQRIEGDEVNGADVLYEAGRLLVVDSRVSEAALGARTMLRFADASPIDDRVGRALGAACVVARRVSSAGSEGDGAAREAGWSSGRAMYESCLRRAIDHLGELEGVDVWRVELARALWSGAGESVVDRVRALEEATGVLSGVADDAVRPVAAAEIARLWLDAMERARRSPEAWAEAGVGVARLAGEAEASLVVAERLCDGATEALAARDALRVLRGEVFVATGRLAEALGVVSDVEAENRALRARAWRVRFEAMLGLGSWDEGFDALGEVAAADRGLADLALRRAEAGAWSSISELAGGFPEVDDRGTRAMEVLTRAVEWRGDEADAVLRERAAWALVLGGRPGDAMLLIDAETADIDRLILLGEARLASGEAAGAFDAFRRVVSGAGAALDRERAFWHAWTRMLEILASRDSDGGRAVEIRREIARLRALESWDSFPACSVRIQRVSREIGP